MKFVCLGFIEESQYNALSEAEGQQMMAECFAYDDQLRRGGHFLGGEALQSANQAVTLRFKEGSVIVTDGPYAETKEMLGGILLLEARDLPHAIELMSRHPGVRVGPFEIRPADEVTNQLIAQRDQPFRAKPTPSFSIQHRLGILAPAAQVFRALATLSGVASWWTRDISGEAGVGQTFTARFHDPSGAELGVMALRVTELESDRRVRWSVEAGPVEWIGTTITFLLQQENDQTIVLFQHQGWSEAAEFLAHCSMKWATFLLSLKQAVECGQGRPAPDDLKIDNWN